MFSRLVFCLCAVILLAGAVFTAQAEVPQTMNIQGVLLDSGCDPVTDPVDVTFTIYDDATAGESKWTETRSVDPDPDGRFTIILGEVEPIIDTVFNEPDRWLGIQVSGDPEIQPRQKLTSTQVTQTAMAQRDADKARADGKAYEIKVQGEAQAEAIRIMGEALAKNPLVVEYKKVEQWGGTFPMTFMGGSEGARVLWSLPGATGQSAPAAAAGSRAQ